MMRTIAFVLGTLSLADGIAGTVNPRYGFKLWESGVKKYFPGWMNDLAREYERLSDGALRYIAVWEILLASVLLFLAVRVRE